MLAAMFGEDRSDRKAFSLLGLLFGGLGFFLAVFHYGAGPFTPRPPIEQVVAEKAVKIKNATIAALRGERPAQPAIPPAAPEWTTDRLLHVGALLLGALAFLMATIAFARREPARMCFAATALGGAAIAFQFVVVAIGMIILVSLLGHFLSALG